MARRGRNDYRRRRRRKQRRKMIASLLAVFIIVGAVVAAVTVFFKVAKFDVTGSTLYTGEEIIAATEIQLGDNMFSINKFDVANKILNKFPYVGEIKIRRHLPDTFVFEITERKSAAYFQSEKFRWLIDRNGYILESIPPDEAVALPLVTGVSLVAPSPGAKAALDAPESLRVLELLLGALEDGGVIEKAGRVDVTKLYNLTITYDGRFVVEFGTEQELERKVKMLKAVIEQLETTDKGIINISDAKQARFRPNANLQV